MSADCYSCRNNSIDFVWGDTMSQWIKAFIGGFLATLIFHQGVYFLLRRMR